MSSIITRLATNEDIDAIMVIVKKSIPLMHAVGNYQWADDYPNETKFRDDVLKQQLWVCEEDNQVLGCGALTEDQGEDYKQLWDINIITVVPHRICVDPDCRGKGVCKLLLLQAEKLSIERGYPSVRVDTNSMNKAMQHILQGLGYQFIGPLKLTGRETLEFVGYEKFLK